MVIVDHAFIDIGSRAAAPASTTGLDSPPELISQTPIVLTVEETSDFGKLPARSRELHRWAASLHPVPASVETARDCVAQLQDARLGNLPLAVVGTANDTPGYSQLQTRLLALSRQSRQFVAEKSFHSVEIDQPEVVIEAIRQVFREASGR